MADKKLDKLFPIKSWQLRKKEVGPFRVECEVSNRWLEFATTSASTQRGSIFWVTVMTQLDGKPARAICELALTKEDLQMALDEMDNPTNTK